MQDTDFPTLKSYCKACGYSYRRRRQGGRYYVTIGDKHMPSNNWLKEYRKIVETYYPNARMTSGSAYGATFMIGDIVSLLKNNG